MWRNRKCRNISWDPKCYHFKPAWVPSKQIQEIELSMDEYEAIRLADFENLNMVDWAQKMWISAPTFNRSLASAHKKIAEAIIEWKSIKICKCNEK